jgi:hypothetical protein
MCRPTCGGGIATSAQVDLAIISSLIKWIRRRNTNERSKDAMAIGGM